MEPTKPYTATEGLESLQRLNHDMNKKVREIGEHYMEHIKHRPIVLLNAPHITNLDETLDRLEREGYIPIVAFSQSEESVKVIPPDMEGFLKLLRSEIIKIVREELIRLKETDGGQ